MGEEPLGHEVVRLDHLVDVFLVDAHRHPHDHVLRPLHHLAVRLQQVGPFFVLYLYLFFCFGAVVVICVLCFVRCVVQCNVRVC